ncbi:MAG: hypothetical protein GEU96_02335 [Propionibacteriales bacterium]|nr:hypothetical protein [Propionibacteriales bacterium]
MVIGVAAGIDEEHGYRIATRLLDVDDAGPQVVGFVHSYRLLVSSWSGAAASAWIRRTVLLLWGGFDVHIVDRVVFQV